MLAICFGRWLGARVITEFVVWEFPADLSDRRLAIFWFRFLALLQKAAPLFPSFGKGGGNESQLLKILRK
jgi:hypothetical protein